jgi:hypothetical protein
VRKDKAATGRKEEPVGAKCTDAEPLDGGVLTPRWARSPARGPAVALHPPSATMGGRRSADVLRKKGKEEEQTNQMIRKNSQRNPNPNEEHREGKGLTKAPPSSPARGKKKPSRQGSKALPPARSPPRAPAARERRRGVPWWRRHLLRRALFPVPPLRLLSAAAAAAAGHALACAALRETVKR